MTSRELTHARDLLRELIARDIKLRYRGSILGILWTLVNPLAELLVLLFVFGTVFRIDIPNFPAYLFTGLIVYGWFQTSLSFATGAVVGNRELIHRPGVPALVLPMVTVAANMVHFLLSLPVLVLLLLITGVGLTPFVLTLPVLVLIEFVLILGCAYFVATFHVQFRDTQHVLTVDPAPSVAAWAGDGPLDGKGARRVGGRAGRFAPAPGTINFKLVLERFEKIGHFAGRLAGPEQKNPPRM